MLTMQAFHTQLHQADAEQNTYFKKLKQVTRCSLSQLEAVKSEMIWELWGVEAS